VPVERAGEEEIVSAKLVIMLLVGTKEFYVQPLASYGYNYTYSTLAIGHFSLGFGAFECRRMGGPVLQYRTLTQHDRH
jgi:hypothetical protein